jgi:hypothetical protein
MFYLFGGSGSDSDPAKSVISFSVSLRMYS